MGDRGACIVITMVLIARDVSMGLLLVMAYVPYQDSSRTLRLHKPMCHSNGLPCVSPIGSNIHDGLRAVGGWTITEDFIAFATVATQR